MPKVDDQITVHRVLRAIDDFISASRRVTKRSLVDGVEIEARRFMQAKKAFAHAKDSLVSAIDQIHPESELGKNIEQLFKTKGFEPLLRHELEQLRAGKPGIPEPIDVKAMSDFPTADRTLDFEAELLRRMNLSSAGLINRAEAVT